MTHIDLHRAIHDAEEHRLCQLSRIRAHFECVAHVDDVRCAALALVRKVADEQRRQLSRERGDELEERAEQEVYVRVLHAPAGLRCAGGECLRAPI